MIKARYLFPWALDVVSNLHLFIILNYGGSGIQGAYEADPAIDPHLVQLEAPIGNIASIGLKPRIWAL